MPGHPCPTCQSCPRLPQSWTSHLLPEEDYTVATSGTSSFQLLKLLQFEEVSVGWTPPVAGRLCPLAGPEWPHSCVLGSIERLPVCPGGCLPLPPRTHTRLTSAVGAPLLYTLLQTFLPELQRDGKLGALLPKIPATGSVGPLPLINGSTLTGPSPSIGLPSLVHIVHCTGL